MSDFAAALEKVEEIQRDHQDRIVRLEEGVKHMTELLADLKAKAESSNKLLVAVFTTLLTGLVAVIIDLIRHSR